MRFMKMRFHKTCFVLFLALSTPSTLARDSSFLQSCNPKVIGEAILKTYRAVRDSKVPNAALNVNLQGMSCVAGSAGLEMVKVGNDIGFFCSAGVGVGYSTGVVESHVKVGMGVPSAGCKDVMSYKGVFVGCSAGVGVNEFIKASIGGGASFGINDLPQFVKFLLNVFSPKSKFPKIHEDILKLTLNPQTARLLGPQGRMLLRFAIDSVRSYEKDIKMNYPMVNFDALAKLNLDEPLDQRASTPQQLRDLIDGKVSIDKIVQSFQNQFPDLANFLREMKNEHFSGCNVYEARVTGGAAVIPSQVDVAASCGISNSVFLGKLEIPSTVGEMTKVCIEGTCSMAKACFDESCRWVQDGIFGTQTKRVTTDDFAKIPEDLFSGLMKEGKKCLEGHFDTVAKSGMAFASTINSDFINPLFRNTHSEKFIEEAVKNQNPVLHKGSEE